MTRTSANEVHATGQDGQRPYNTKDEGSNLPVNAVFTLIFVIAIGMIYLSLRKLIRKVKLRPNKRNQND